MEDAIDYQPALFYLKEHAVAPYAQPIFRCEIGQALDITD